MGTAQRRDDTQAADASRSLVAERFRIEKSIGRGRLGEIFAATDEHHEKLGVDRKVAVQILPENIVGGNKLFNKLNLGFAVLRAAGHPNLVEHLHFGRDGKLGYLVTEYLQGAPLRALLAESEWLPIEDVLPVLRGVGDALQLLHAKDFVHGNLTTDNVFITDTLEVRLLDVVPVEASEAIFRGAAMSEPFSRCTVEDDVFGLACVAYTMLSGKHPYNYSAPGEAAQAGMTPESPAMLPDDQWTALRAALDTDRQARTRSVGEFLEAFGVSGGERLQPLAPPPVRPEPVRKDSPSAPSGGNLDDNPFGVVDPVTVVHADYSAPSRARNGRTRTGLLALLLCSLGAWVYYGEAEERFVELIGFVDESLDIGLTQASVRADNVQAVAAQEPLPVAIDEIESAFADAQRDTAVLPGSSAKTKDESPAIAAGPPVAGGNEDSVVETVVAELVIAESIVAVSERDGAARIRSHSTGDSTALPVVWWTSEHTASADADFIAVSEQRISTSSDTDGSVFHVPLVNDNRHEPRESFFVNFGLRDAAAGQIERIATVRVDIIDDDLP